MGRDAAAEVHHEAPDRHYGAYWNDEEIAYLRAVLEHAFELGGDFPNLRERVIYAVAGTTGFEIPASTLQELRRTSRKQVKEQTQTSRPEPKKKSGSRQVEEFCLEDPEAGTTDEDSDNQLEDMRSSASQGHWG